MRVKTSAYIKNLLNFYDGVHFTRKGSEVIGDILAQDFLAYLEGRQVD